MNLKSIRDTIIATIGPDTELQVANFNVFINEGKNMIVAKIMDEKKNFFPDSESQSLSASDIDIVPAKTWENITLIQVDFGDGAGYRTLTKGSLEEVRDPNCQKMIYCLWGDTIYVPNWAKAYTILIFGYVIPDDMAENGDVPPFSALLHGLLVVWGISRAIESNSASEDYSGGARKRQEFWDELERILPTVMSKDSTNVRSLT